MNYPPPSLDIQQFSLVPDILQIIQNLCDLSLDQCRIQRRLVRKCVELELPDLLFNRPNVTGNDAKEADWATRSLLCRLLKDKVCDTDRLQQCVDYLFERHEAIMADCTLQPQYLQELDDIIASFDEKGTQNFRPFRIHRVVETVKYNSLTGRLDRGKEYVMRDLLGIVASAA